MQGWIQNHQTTEMCQWLQARLKLWGGKQNLSLSFECSLIVFSSVSKTPKVLVCLFRKLVNFSFKNMSLRKTNVASTWRCLCLSQMPKDRAQSCADLKCSNSSLRSAPLFTRVITHKRPSMKKQHSKFASMGSVCVLDSSPVGTLICWHCMNTCWINSCSPQHFKQRSFVICMLEFGTPSTLPTVLLASQEQRTLGASS